VWTWGYQSEDPKNPGIVFYTEPVQVEGLAQVVGIAAGSGHAVAVVKGGTVHTWGNNASGELGDGTTTYSAVPVEIRSLSNVVAVSASHSHTLALLADGTVQAWGSNEFGQLGIGSDGDFSTVPVQVGSLTNIVAIVAARTYSMALQSDGTIWAWGAPNAALGLASTTNVTSPQQVFFGLLDQNANFMDDRWELQYFGNLDQTGEGDYDGDGISNLAEFQSSHTNPVAGDSDGDFVSDGEEIEQGSDPNDNTSYPPRLRDASRYLRMTSYLVYAHIEYWLEAPWSTLPGGEDDISPHPFLRELGPILGARVALPNDVGRSYGSSMISATSYLDNVAWIQHRRLWLHRFPATGVEARQKVIVNRHHDIDGKVDPPLARIETLTIPPGQTTSNPIDSSTDLEQVQVVPYLAVPEGVVESIWPLDTYAVSFGGATSEYYELKSDDGAILYTAPQWLDVDHDPDSTNAALGERNNAVAFKRKTKPQIGAVFLLQGFPANYPIKIRAHGSDGVEIPATNPVRQNDYFEVPATTESTTAFPDTIKYYNKNDSTAFTLTWQISLDNEQTWLELGTTKHTVYLTWDDPVTSLRQESLFHLGCRQANGIEGLVSDAAKREAITEAIWTDFGNREVRRVDTIQLKYYGSYLVPFSPVHETELLLATGDGQCSAWAKLFLDIRKVQGLEDDFSYILLRPFPLGVDKGFIIANWSFASSGHSGHPDYPYLNLPDSPLATQDSYHWRGTPEVNDERGIAGQGTLDPASLFMNHRVVFLHNRYYDPSYGVTYSDLSSIETGVIVGFSLVDPRYPLDEPTVHLDLNGNGNMTDLQVPTLVYLFKTNGPAVEITETPSTY
jgi:hypothetical protein